ncbi:MAG: cytochrome oxidase small assembly protein [Rugosibacter sp.]|nr:cytochrome oxidase small assembly protein [Rugosibacter sp.]
MSGTNNPKNLRTALILGAVALAVFFGFIARYWYLQK